MRHRPYMGRLGFWFPAPIHHSESADRTDRKSTRLNSSHGYISYAVFCLKKKNTHQHLHFDQILILAAEELDGILPDGVTLGQRAQCLGEHLLRRPAVGGRHHALYERSPA